MITVANADLDSRILRILDQQGGSTAWAMTGTLSDVPLPRIKDRLASLRRRGIVTCRGSYWKRATAETRP